MADLFDIMYESQSNSTKQEEATKPVEIIKQTETINPVQTADVITQQQDLGMHEVKQQEQIETTGVLSRQEVVEILDTEPSTSDTNNIISDNIVSGSADNEMTQETSNTFPALEVEIQPKTVVPSPAPAYPTTSSPAAPPIIPDYSSPPLGVIDGISLMEMEFSPPVVIVKNLFHTGLSVIAGPPKEGKSWWCLNLSLSVATGTEIIGFETNKCEVLYLSFESKQEELQHRLNIMLQGDPMPNGVHFCTDIKTLDNGLLEFLQDTLNQYPKIKLIIIDTLQFIRSSKTGGGTLYQKEYREMSILKGFADKNNVCILAVHHLKNTPTKDVFAKMYGSNAIRGATNTNIVMIKDDDTSNVHFHVESRDVENTIKIIQMNNENCKWEVVSDDVEEDTYRENPIVITINKMLEEQPDGVEIKMADFKDRMIKDLEIDEEKYSPQSISREISQHLIPLLMRYDNIRCKRPDANGGIKGRVWKFYYEKVDTISETESTITDNNVI